MGLLHHTIKLLARHYVTKQIYMISQMYVLYMHPTTLRYKP